VDDVTWAALALTLTLLGGTYTWLAFRRRGVAAGLRGASFTLVPLALYLTHTLRLLTGIGEEVVDWAARLVLSPTVWLGVIVAAVAVVLFVVSGVLENRGIGTSKRLTDQERSGERRPEALPAGRRGRNEPVISDVDPELAEIEALLRKRGIT
jgi:hypothetical protein